MTGPHAPIGAFVAGSHGEPLGHIVAIYADNATGRPAWAAVRGPRHTAVVPLETSRYDGATLHIPYDSEQLRTAPVHDPDTLISYPQGDDLARHYGLIPPDPPTGELPRAGTEAMIRSEEQLRAGAVNVVVGRARLVTYVVTEDQTFTIPVRRQEARLVYDPVPDHEQVVSAVDPAEEVHEVVLHAEQVLFTTQVVPVERVRMVRRVVTAEKNVSTRLGAEQIDVDHTDEHTDNGQVGAGRHHDDRET